MSSNASVPLPAESSSLNSSCEIGSETMTKRSTGSATNEKDCCRDGTDSRFACNICFDEVQEPVVTRCGHLYCWPCLFQWLEPGMRPEERESLGMSGFYGRKPSRRVCPVCKSECPLSAIVPVYVRSSSPVRRKKPRTDEPINDANEIDSGETASNEEESDATSNTFESGIAAADEGLRRRRPNRTFDDSNTTEDNSSESIESVPVPNRPSVNHPQHQQEEPSSPPTSRRNSPGSSPQARARTDNPYRVGSVQLTPRSPNGHNGSLTYGILSSLQRATSEYYRSNNNNNSADESDRRRIPSLHDVRNPNADGSGRFREPSQSYPIYNESNGILQSETTQYLTRLLIMLTSFVIFCFLMV